MSRKKKTKTKKITVKCITEVDNHIKGAYVKVVKHCLLQLGKGYAWDGDVRLDFVLKK